MFVGRQRIYWPRIAGLSQSKNGCSITWESDLPADLHSLAWIFPKGCYGDCQRKFGGTVIGPYGVFDAWSWMQDGIASVSGNHSNIEAFESIPYDHTFQMMLADSGCQIDVGDLELRKHRCEPCSFRPSVLDIIPKNIDGICAYEVTFTINNSGSQVSWITISSPESFGYFIGNSLAASPGSSNHTVIFYPLNGFASGMVKVLFTSQYRNAECQSEIPVTLPLCQEFRPSSIFDKNDNDPRLSSLQVAPNPSTGKTVVSYDFYDEGGEKSWRLSICLAGF